MTHSNRVGWVIAIAVMLLAPALACTTTRSLSGPSEEQTWALQVSHAVPAAKGKVEVDDASSSNKKLEITVEHLAPPSNVWSGDSQYVVWIVPHKGEPQNMGVLPLGKNLDAKFKTQTPYRSFDVVITAEEEANVTEPSSHRVMSVDIRTQT